MKQRLSIFFYLASLSSCINSSAPTIFVPRQLSYNPIFENADICSSKISNQKIFSELYKSDNFTLSAKPIYTQSVGSKFKSYFTINNKPVLSVQENGSGDINSLWLQVITSPTGFYSSQLSFAPKRITFGTMLYGLVNITDTISVCANTALISTRNNMNILETKIAQLSKTPGLHSITQAFSNPDLLYGTINGMQSKSGLDDIQIKLIYHSYETHHADYDHEKKFYYEIYALAGIPTGTGSQAKCLFEPLVGSHHAQIGFGGNLHYQAKENLTFQAEAKWRYAFASDETRSFDLTQNGQWSRYMLIVNSLTPLGIWPAINSLTFPATVTPRNSFDLYIAACYDFHETWHAEIGYDVWIRQKENVSVNPVFAWPSIGIADIYNSFPPNNPTSASTANISQSAYLYNPAPSDSPNFIPIQASDLNLSSAGAPQSLSNSIYGTISYTKEMNTHIVRTGLSLAYECGHGINVPNNITIWINCDVSF